MNTKEFDEIISQTKTLLELSGSINCLLETLKPVSELVSELTQVSKDINTTLQNIKTTLSV